MSGGTKKFSVTIPEELAATVQARIGGASFSAYVSKALARQVERDNLRELIAAAESRHGPADRAGVEAKRALLRTEPEARGGDHPSAA
ncbi:CopG family transcriptional regulator [Streptosporangium sp. CA-135522]|uniref:CopG family transcriptional regulator n=1 Tax=Streptosporangium sp. CA-135522 TaxID=3240072 RepID=UPI003D92A547